jgi:putative heme-binding domain-containing protein
VLRLLDGPDGDRLRALALRVVADQAEPVVVDGLLDRVTKETQAARRLAYADALTRVYKKPGPWVYWGYRPPPRPANTVAWERTTAIEEALDRLLTDPHRSVRLAVLRRLQREAIPTRAESLGRWLAEERRPESVTAILAALKSQPPARVRQPLVAVVRDKGHSLANRLLALALLADNLDKKTPTPLLELSRSLEDGPVVAEVLKRLGPTGHAAVPRLLLDKLASPSAAVRAAALEVLAELRIARAEQAIFSLLGDGAPEVRRAAAVAAGKMEVRAASDLLLKRVADTDPGVRRASLDALRRIGDARAVPRAVAALTDSQTEVQALECVVALGTPAQAEAVKELAKRNPSAEILGTALRGLTAWGLQEGVPNATRADLNRAVAEVQGASGALIRWHVAGPLPETEMAQLMPQVAAAPRVPFALPGQKITWRTSFATGTEARWNLGKVAAGSWVGFSDLLLAEATAVQFLGSAGIPYGVWVNGRLVYKQDKAGPFRPDADRFSAKLDKGLNRVVIQLTARTTTTDIQLRFRRVSSRAAHEQLTEAALTRKGNPERGRQVFFAAEKSMCVKCHRLGDQGERIGPELTGVGSRFSRVYLVESILEPSRTIAPSFETVVVELKDGRVFTGVPVAEDDAALTLADSQSQKHRIAKADIAERRRHPLSTMPDGLEQRLTTDEFVDLIAFLASQKGGRDR